MIPGASRLEHIEMNTNASKFKDLSPKEMHEVEKIYEIYIKSHVHYMW